MLELNEQIEDSIVKYTILRDEIINKIHKLDDDVYIEILYKVYVDNFRLSDIAEDMGYEYQTIRLLHTKAVKTFADKYGL